MRPLEDFQQKSSFTLLIGSDHGGYDTKRALVEYLTRKGVQVEDVGPCNLDPSDDYPDFAGIVGSRISQGTAGDRWR